MLKMVSLYADYRQSMWMDYIDRNLLINGGLATLVSEGLRGVTSNPTIFHKAIGGSSDYDDTIRDLVQADPDLQGDILSEWISIQDVRMAADILASVYKSSNGSDGFVSLEVSPYLAFDTDATIQAARHLWRAVDRPNLMIKVPGTVPGLPAIERLIAEGINVNVTLLFSALRYQAAAEAYQRGLALNPEPGKVASVASFFVSRVDSKIDPMLDKIGGPEAQSLKGKIAIANAKMAYQQFKEIEASEAFAAERARGARPQRPLWASTGTKNPAYSDVLYVDQLIGPETVNTVTPETLDAFQTHGEIAPTLEAGVETARRQLETLGKLGIDLAEVCQELEQEGVKKFIDSHDQLLAVLEDKRGVVAKRSVSG
ncbi:MAG: transaldolase [Thiogranum sp.]|nr:transaldolase [Thiogranum sp.]